MMIVMFESIYEFTNQVFSDFVEEYVRLIFDIKVTDSFL